MEKVWKALFSSVIVTDEDKAAAERNEFQQLVAMGGGNLGVGISLYSKQDLGPEPQVLKDLREEESTEAKLFDES